MFTEGLDKSALRWVKEGSVNNKKEVPMSMSSQRPRIDPVSSARTGSRGFGLPPTSKFRSGHLPDMIPVSRTIPRQYDDSRSESENDMSTDSEEEVYGRRYSLDSSPQDDRVTSSAATRRYSNPAERRVQYGSDSMYSEDVSSSRETVGRGRGGVVDRLMKGANRYPVGSNGYTEEESSDSAASSEFSSTVRRSDIGLPGSKAYLSEGYASSVPSWINKQSASNKNQKLSDDDNPSAPPFSDAGGEIKQEQSPVSTRPNDMPSAAASVATDGFERKTRTTSLQNNIRQETPKTSGRVAASAENGVPFSSFPARLPTFHASALGPWHAVIAYDACVRLCLHAWAKGCMEAPMFLENECALLRNTFGLQQVLLQSEEELLLSKRSSELAGEGAIPKPKKMVGKMKVQVRKVKMSLDPPTGCSFSNVKAPKIKMEVIKDRFSNFQSTVSSGWQAVRSIHFAPRVSENGSFSRQSLAYVQASTQYLKQVSGLLKTGVATLRSSPSSYDVQETYSSLLRLKSSAEEDAIRMQPGSGETHVFFPDSLGDDLIVEVQDSKGKYYGRVVAQVAAISEDPGNKLRWWSIYREPEHELVGKLQLFINYSTTLDENSHLKDLSIQPKYLVSFTVGYNQRQNIDAAVKKFSENFTILLFHYDNRASEWDEYEWSKKAIHISAQKQTKWWYAKRFLHPDVVAAYDYIFIWDEDLGVENFTAEEYIRLVKKHGLEISQPGLDPRRGLTWQMTRRRENREVHKKTEERPGWCKDPHLPPCAAFVEIMAPVFSRDAWRCVWHMIQNDLVHGWGLDLALQKCVKPAHEKIGVVDAQWIVHQGIPSLGSQGQADEGKQPWQGVRERCKLEWKMFQQRFANAEKNYNMSMGIDPSNTTSH